MGNIDHGVRRELEEELQFFSFYETAADDLPAGAQKNPAQTGRQAVSEPADRTTD